MSRARRAGSIALACAAALGAGCGGAGSPSLSRSTSDGGRDLAPSGAARGAAPLVDGSCAALRPGRVAPGSAVRQSSAVALARAGDRTLAYAADADDVALHTFDLDGQRELAVTPLDGAPSQVLVLPDGRVAVTLRDANRVAVLEPAAHDDAPLELRCSITVPSEPFALARSKRSDLVAVTSAWGRMLTVLDGDSFGRRFSVELPRDPRAVLIDDAGQRAFVSHGVGGVISVVRLDGERHEARQMDVRIGERGRDLVGRIDNRSREAGQGYALAAVQLGSVPDDGKSAGGFRVLAPMVSVDPGKARVSKGYGGEPRWGEPPRVLPAVAVVDGHAERPLTKAAVVTGVTHGRECLLPRAAAAHGDAVFVACLGIDAVLELDARSLNPINVERRRFRVPSGPVGIAVDAAGKRLVTFSQFARALSVAALDGRDGAVMVIPASKKTSQWTSGLVARGRELFHASDDLRISGDGRACASCHPDGRDDALTWSTPDGPRQTIMLAGRVTDAQPFGWFGASKSLDVHLAHTFARLGGRGFHAAADGDDLRALAAYLTALPAPPTSAAPADVEQLALVDRGKELFFDARQGCATCHAGGGADGTAHDVGSGDVTEKSVRFDTPSLRFIGGTAPYFHDGRFRTLESMLEVQDGKMGHTTHLSRADMRALAAFMETL
jgi:mono/diheme cytochrome c family protein